MEVYYQLHFFFVHTRIEVEHAFAVIIEVMQLASGTLF